MYVVCVAQVVAIEMTVIIVRWSAKKKKRREDGKIKEQRVVYEK